MCAPRPLLDEIYRQWSPIRSPQNSVPLRSSKYGILARGVCSELGVWALGTPPLCAPWAHRACDSPFVFDTAVQMQIRQRRLINQPFQIKTCGALMDVALDGSGRCDIAFLMNAHIRKAYCLLLFRVFGSNQLGKCSAHMCPIHDQTSLNCCCHDDCNNGPLNLDTTQTCFKHTASISWTVPKRTYTQCTRLSTFTGVGKGSAFNT